MNKLLVEGKDDFHVVCSFTKYFSIPDVFSVKDKNGIDNLLNSLDVEFEESGLLRLGIMIDADVDIASRWQSLLSHIISWGYQNVPNILNENGTVLRQDGLPSIGVWIMPDNRLNGMLEDFISYLVNDEDKPLWDYAGEAINNIPNELCKFSQLHRSKAHIHTWLAWQEEPGRPMGLAITMNYLNPKNKTAKIFINWIRDLFEIN